MPATETRAAASSGTDYTSRLIDSAFNAAAGLGARIDGTAAAEICAGAWGRAFASAVVRPNTTSTRALTPAVLEAIGRQLVLAGEAAFEIRIRRGRVELDPVCAWTVEGDATPSTWAYQLTFSGPTTTSLRRVTGARVVHPRYAASPAAPWRGLSPLALQRETAQLAANLETRLRQEAGGVVGRLVTVPGGSDVDELAGDLKGLAGGTMLVPTTAGGWEGSPMDAPKRDWHATRLGADPPAGEVRLRNDVVGHVLAATGCPVDFVARTDGTSRRESWRQFLSGTIGPVARLVASELGEKLDTPGLELTFDDLRASDLTGRSRAFGQLRTHGVRADAAARIAGFDGLTGADFEPAAPAATVAS